MYIVYYYVKKYICISIKVVTFFWGDERLLCFCRGLFGIGGKRGLCIWFGIFGLWLLGS